MTGTPSADSGLARRALEVAKPMWESREVRWSAASGILLAIGFLAGPAGATGSVTSGIYVVGTVVGLRFFALEGFEVLIRHKVVGIELLMAVAAVTAGVLGLWGEAATLAFLYSISEALEEFTEDRTRNAIRALMDLAPKRVTRLASNGEEEIVELDQIDVGDRFLVRPGQGVATDGVVDEGNSAVDESAVTGESIPVEKGPGDQVFAGTLNASGALVVTASATSVDNTLAKIVQLVTEAQQQKGHSERFMRRFSRRYSPAVLVAGVLVAIIGGALTGDWETWAVRAATVIVAAAPCALVISIPVTYVAAMGSAGRRGVLIKGGVHLEELAAMRVLALDKTGTLTRAQPTVTEIHPVADIDERQLVAVAAGVERRSEHPLALAISRYAHSVGVDLPEVSAFRSLVGAGAEATINGTDYVVGSARLMEERRIDLGDISRVVEALQAQGDTAVVIADAERVLGVVGISDSVRPDAAEAMLQLRSVGIERLVMLTGDNSRTAAAVADQVGINDYFAELRPEDKSETVAALKLAYGNVGMVGDGINDTPALAAASVGIAMGAAGSDVALETADVVLMADDLRKLVDAVEIGRRTRRVVRQNLVMSAMILAVLVPGALVGWFTLPVAVLAHELSELVVIGNGIRVARG